MRFYALIISLFLSLVIPSFAFSQESQTQGDMDNPSSILSVDDTNALQSMRTTKDNFGGLRLGGNIMFGFGRCDDKTCFGQPDEQDWNAKNTTWATMLQFEIGYLWGNEMFAGPVLNLHTGFPDLFGGDVRIMAIMPFSYNNAVTMGVGVGLEGFNMGRMEPDEGRKIYVSQEDGIGPDGYPQYGKYDDKLNWWIGQIYLPIQIGYEHVFENGFTLGCSLELKLRFNAKTDDYLLEGKYSYDGGALLGSKERANLKFYQLLAGIHLGYSL